MRRAPVEIAFGFGMGANQSASVGGVGGPGAIAAGAGASGVAARFEEMHRAAREAEVAVTPTWKTKATAATTGSYKKSLTPSGAPPPRRSLADLP